MLSKCANPACSAKFQYLGVGKLFVIKARRSITKSESQSFERSQIHEPTRYFWLCASCSQSLTIEACGSGRARIARTRVCSQDDRGAPSLVNEPGVASHEAVFSMNPKEKLDALTKELEFLERGGYRMMLGWRAPLVFEDSPICPKAPHAACSGDGCVLMDFVPQDQRDQAIPCRHIPLNNIGETLNTLYPTATTEEIENTLREWLKSEIANLESSIDLPVPGAA